MAPQRLSAIAGPLGSQLKNRHAFLPGFQCAVLGPTCRYEAAPVAHPVTPLYLHGRTMNYAVAIGLGRGCRPSFRLERRFHLIN